MKDKARSIFKYVFTNQFNELTKLSFKSHFLCSDRYVFRDNVDRIRFIYLLLIVLLYYCIVLEILELYSALFFIHHKYFKRHQTTTMQFS